MHRAKLMMMLAGVGMLVALNGVPWGGVAAQEPAAPPAQPGPYIGQEACKACHSQQHEAWAKTKHARSFSRLGGDDKAGGQCIRCHVTGTAEMIAAEGAEPSFPNVQCEACHGPGRAHVGAAMTGSAASVKPAPVIEESCTRCHNDSSPHYRPFYFAALRGLVHPTR